MLSKPRLLVKNQIIFIRCLSFKSDTVIRTNFVRNSESFGVSKNLIANS